MLRRLAFMALLLGPSLLGCVREPRPVTSTYNNGPTAPLDAVLAKINENNGRISTLVADGRFSAVLANGRGGFEPLDGGITIVHTKPDQIRVVGQLAVVGQRAFDLGSNGRQYWMSAFGPIDTTWYGTPRGTANVDPRLPIAPELLVDVLGIATLNQDLLAQPVPTMRYNPDHPAYMLTWHQPMTDRWVTVREVWYDRENLRPFLVILFDRNGRAVLRAKLSNYQAIDLEAPLPAGQTAPIVARTFELFLPESRSSMRFTLDGVYDRRNGAPNPRLSYRFSVGSVTTGTQINLDDQPATQP